MKTLKLNVDYTVGQTVYLRARQEKLAGMVVGFTVRPLGVLYLVGWGDATESGHCDFELAEIYDSDFSPDC